VYEPHIAPAIDRWKLEYQAARRRRQAQEAAMHRSETDLLMSQRDGPSSRREDDDEDISDDDRPLRGLGTKLMKDGLLLRRQEQTPSYQDSVELDDLVAREVSEWRNEVTGQVLRQRRNVSEHSAMDEVRSFYLCTGSSIEISDFTVKPFDSIYAFISLKDACRRRFFPLDFSKWKSSFFSSS